MRHLSVPRQDTQQILQSLKAESALPSGARVRTDPTNPDRRLIPFTDSISQSMVDQYPVIEIEIPPKPSRTYKENLSKILSSEDFQSIEWPTRHEFIGDIILIKLDEKQRKFGPNIGEALLQQHPRARAVFEDNGVMGTFRVRDLKLLSVRENQPALTRTRIIEGGHYLWTDPATVYYSSRLSHEREGTLECAKNLSLELGRPLKICDPYAGVGPSLIPLLSEPDLVGELFAGDLNPSAVEFLKENITFPDAIIECSDARDLKNRPELIERFDLLLVNIPHDTLDHLPTLLPLVRPNGIIRGWAVIEDDQFESAQEQLRRDVNPMAYFEIRRSYSATANLCRFETRKATQ
ncbi:MAG: hypothetical protein VX473_05905 [Candidatus Thermoplasmatota archaeon]|nr:hypothetical protein [Candidatus Thermoplasmatota archaeon]